MLRLGPTAIVLGESDLKDYSRHEARRKAEANLKLLNLSSVDAHNAPNNRLPRKVSAAENQESPKSPEALRSFSSTSSSTDSIAGELDFVNVTIDQSVPPGPNFSPIENESRTLQSSPVKDGDFHYGGFTESPSQQTPGSSSFTPDDASTPQNLQPLEQRESRLRAPLPRSPLYLSQNVSQSPEHRPTSGLTPRVMSRVATHNSPGVIFSAPPRRPPRNHPKFRHQTNSFSFDESERSSAAYDQERTASGSTNESTPRPSADLNLHDELRGSSLHDSVGLSTNSDPAIPSRESGDTVQSSRNPTDPRRQFIFSSPTLPLSDEEIEDDDEDETSPNTELPQLPLPPPFSAVSRDMSNSDLLPEVKCGTLNLQASPVNAPSSPLSQTSSYLGQSIEDDNSNHLETGGEVDDTGPSTFRRISSPASIIARLVSNYKPRSPRTRDSTTVVTSTSPGVSSTPQGAKISSSHTQTPREYQVYNDDLSPDSQPQTPAHLPESRHRSRYHPSWTAPTNRDSRRRRNWLVNNDGAGADLSEVRVESVFATPSRITRGGRSGSPTGMQSQGFEGLYGGRENGDDEQSWVDGVRFDNAEARLFSPAATGNDDERSLNDTPEREDWRSHLR